MTATTEHDAIAVAIRAVRNRIAEACRLAGRSLDEVRLVAVAKTVPVERVRAGFDAGLADLGENRAVDLARRAQELPAATWHFLGRLQTGTVRHVADHAEIVHSAEPGRAVEALGRRCASAGRTIDCLVQVDFTGGVGERQGTPPDGLDAFADRLAALRGIRLAGLMVIPPPTPEPEGARPYFARLRELRDGLVGRHPGAAALSMGMSADYTVAVEEGATMVRVGTALFGPRPHRPVEGSHGAPGAG